MGFCVRIAPDHVIKMFYRQVGALEKVEMSSASYSQNWFKWVFISTLP